MKRLLFAVAALVLHTAVSATPIDFEGLGNGTLLTTQITGFEFSNAVVLESGLGLNELEFPPVSGVAVVVDDGGPMEINFIGSISSFKAFFTYMLPVTLSAYDSGGGLLGSVSSLFSENYVSSGNAPNELLSLSGSGISMVVIEGDPFGGSFAMDNMSVVTSPVPEPSTLFLLLTGVIGLLVRRIRNTTGMIRALCVLPVLGLCAVQSTVYAAQGFQSISATPPTVVKDTPTTVIVEATPFDDPKLLPTSLRLHRDDGAGWYVVGSMVDNGTQGDAVAGDGVYSSETTIDQSNGQVMLRASAGYSGSFRRVQSSTATVSLIDPISLDINSGIPQVQMIVGETKNISYFLEVGNGTGSPVTATVTETVAPGAGLSVTSDNLGAFTALTTTTFNINQVVTAQAEGDYEIKVTSEIAALGLQDTVVVHVTVYEEDIHAELLPLGSYPSGVAIGQATDVLFTVNLIGSDGLVVNALNLERLDDTGTVVLEDLGPMADDGSNGDLSAGDSVFSTTVSLIHGTAGVVYFQATADIAGLGPVVSPPFALQVTPFPIGIAPPLPGHVITDPDDNEILNNELLVSFVEDTTDSDIVDIAASISGTVVGTIPGAGIYQIRFPGDATFNGLFAAASMLIADGRVDTVEPNAISGSDAFPDDTRLGSQWGVEKIRADEAWLIAKGAATIAIVDSGIDASHEDLSSKVVKGHDYVDDDEDPNDEQGHGTHVAGIAAAVSNNGKGVAGVAWDSKILIIRQADKNGKATVANLAAGIREAADKGAKVINVSISTKSKGGFFGSKGSLEKAVDYAHGKGTLVVASAGNDGATDKKYPAAYANAMAIGSTTNTDTRSGFSNHGSWVTMAAPGSGILSTSPSYDVTMNTTHGLAKNYGSLNGTSQAAPHVSGAAAVLWSVHPTWSPDQIRQRLVDSAKPLPGQDLGAGRLDLFEAVFNGNFEMGNLDEWSFTGTASVLDKLGPLSPPDGKGFVFVSTGPGGDNVATTLSHDFTVQAGITELPIRFDYNFVTEEYPEFVGTIYNDSMKIVVVAPNGSTTILATESVNGSNFSSIGGIDFPGGDNTVGETGWRKATATIPITAGAGTYRVRITDAGDDVYDSVVLIDHIELKK